MRLALLTHTAALLVCLLFLFLGDVVAARKPKPAATLPLRQSRYDRFLQKVFDKADTDADGRMTLTETYEWILRFYIVINRKAPVNPPTLRQVKNLIQLTDDNRDNYITQEEFRDLAEICARRAGVRIVAIRFIQMIIAPLLAEGTLQWLKQQTWLYEKVVVPYVPERFIPRITKPVVGRTVLMILFVSQLGRIVMEIINDMLDERLNRRIQAEERQKAAAKKKGRR
mmetsp:Transcript_22760/g.43261  ORF Transcript_22760/g.43261 Transcript_22760/m.43261 type:complete len:227 (+) Transcript_22760:982-1662(+)|eukprot:scaffold407_cov168-Amphora_coffeaeformis.AAC.12